jgi:hypothetical protein
MTHSYSCSSSLSLTTIANTTPKRHILCPAMRDLGKVHTETCASLGSSLSDICDNVAASVLQCNTFSDKEHGSLTLYFIIIDDAFHATVSISHLECVLL